MKVEKLGELFYDLKITDQKITKIFEEKMGFSLTRYQILNYLNSNGKMIQKTLQEKLKIDQAAITRHLKILENNNLIVKQRNEKNNREIFVSITEKGLERITNCKEGQQFRNEVFENGFTDKDFDQLANLLKKFNNSIKGE